MPAIKPLDEATILESVRKTGRVVTAEEAQIAAGFGSVIAELLAEQLPVPLKRLGKRAVATANRVHRQNCLTTLTLLAKKMLPEVAAWVRTVPQYRPGF